MKTEADCLACFLRQALQVARIVQCSPAKQLQVVKKVAAIVAELDCQSSPPANALSIYLAIADITACNDPYRQLKSSSNQEALQSLPVLREELLTSSQPLLEMLRIAIVGNCIDYGAFASVNLDKALTRSRKEIFSVDHSQLLCDRIGGMNKGDTVLYLADNSGEIVYDSLLIEYLFQRGLVITIAVKDGPIINDALVEDALAAGLDRFGRIISNGTRCPGTVLPQCTTEFRRLFATSDLVIAKGQGNFESLSEVDREVFFLLMLKCRVAARHMADLAGIDAALLPGESEMVVYCSTMKHTLQTE